VIVSRIVTYHSYSEKILRETLNPPTHTNLKDGGGEKQRFGRSELFVLVDQELLFLTLSTQPVSVGMDGVRTAVRSNPIVQSNWSASPSVTVQAVST
jgi:hypothetical protein